MVGKYGLFDLFVLCHFLHQYYVTSFRVYSFCHESVHVNGLMVLVCQKRKFRIVYLYTEEVLTEGCPNQGYPV